jgi:hypothetical protein
LIWKTIFLSNKARTGKNVLKCENIFQEMVLEDELPRAATTFVYGLPSKQTAPFPRMAALQKGLSFRGYTRFEIVSVP